MRYYEALGLNPKLALDSEELKKHFYEHSRQWHPDRFGRSSPADQEKSLEMTSVINDAFRTLRDPLSRAEYFLEESGINPSKQVPPELLEEVFEMNIALEELRAGDESARPQLIEARERFHNMQDAIDDGLSVFFAQYDEHQDASRLLSIRSALDRRQYVANLIRDVEKELNVHASN
jgi:molecular chaperone HscB